MNLKKTENLDDTVKSRTCMKLKHADRGGGTFERFGQIDGQTERRRAMGKGGFVHQDVLRVRSNLSYFHGPGSVFSTVPICLCAARS